MKLVKFYTILLVALLANYSLINTEEVLKSFSTKVENSNEISISKEKVSKPTEISKAKKVKKDNKSKKTKALKNKKGREDFGSRKKKSVGRSSSRSKSPSRAVGRKSYTSTPSKSSVRPLSNSQFTRPAKNSSRPSSSASISRPFSGYSPRPYTAGLLGWPYSSYYWGWRGAYWWPYFSWRWIRGIHYYPFTYIKSNIENCLDICEVYAANCESYKVKYDSVGNLKCSCSDSSENTIVEKYCWTPKKCILAKEVGCSTILKKIIQKKALLEDDESFDKK